MVYHGCWTEYEENKDIDSLAHDLSDWTGFILKIEGLLNWESPRLLFLVLSAVSTVFLLLYWCQPTIVTTIGCLGLVFSVVGFIGPTISARIPRDISPEDAKRRYREFCRRLVHARYLLIGFIRFLRELRAQHPVIYLFTCLPLLSICGFIGLQLGDLLLVYILTLMCILTPGIRYKGIISMSIVCRGQQFEAQAEGSFLVRAYTPLENGYQQCDGKTSDRLAPRRLFKASVPDVSAGSPGL